MLQVFPNVVDLLAETVDVLALGNSSFVVRVEHVETKRPVDVTLSKTCPLAHIASFIANAPTVSSRHPSTAVLEHRHEKTAKERNASYAQSHAMY